MRLEKQNHPLLAADGINGKQAACAGMHVVHYPAAYFSWRSKASLALYLSKGPEWHDTVTLPRGSHRLDKLSWHVIVSFSMSGRCSAHQDGWGPLACEQAVNQPALPARLFQQVCLSGMQHLQKDQPWTLPLRLAWEAPIAALLHPSASLGLESARWQIERTAIFHQGHCWQRKA